jgi:hypothetical protein
MPVEKRRGGRGPKLEKVGNNLFQAQQTRKGKRRDSLQKAAAVVS